MPKIKIQESENTERRGNKVWGNPIIENFLEEKDLSAIGNYEDIDKIVRVTTKITNSEDDGNFCRPIILPARHPVMKLLILHQHKKMELAGTQLLLNPLRENYWIVKGRKSIRDVPNTCSKCRRHGSRHFDTNTGTLPSSRARDALILEIVGADFAGPLL